MAAPQTDPGAVLGALGIQPAGPCDSISGGWDTHIWKFPTTDGRFHALRLYREADERSQAGLAFEVAAMAAVRKAGLPVPEVQAHGVFEGRPALVMEWVDGETLLELPSRRPWLMPVIAREMGRTQARLHRVPPPEALPRIDPPWIERNIAHRGLSDALIEQGRFDTFCHLDYHPLNLVGRDRRIVGILDWTNAAVCDRRADLAFTHTALREVPLPPGRMAPLWERLRRLFYRFWRQGYAAEAGSIPLDPLWVALGIYRYYSEVERAVSEGRGWVDESGLAKLKRVRDLRLEAAGLAPGPA